MRILQIAPPWFRVPPTGYGGIERVVATLADGLVDAGHDVVLLASRGSRTRAELWTVFDEPPSKQIGSPAHEIRHCMRGYAERHHFDVVHDHGSVVGAALASLAGGPPLVHTVHGAWEPSIAAAYASLPRGLHIVAISADHARRAPVGLELAAVVPNGIDLGVFPFRATPAEDPPYLAFVGRASPDKGPDVAIEVARRTRRRLRMALKVNEAAEHVYFEQVLRPRLPDADVDVVLNGSAAQAAAILAGAEATLVPISWDEPFGLIFAESMASGTPVLAYDRGAARELVADGETGYLVAPGDLEGLCTAVGAVATLDRRACRHRVELRFSARAMVDRYLSLYERVLAERGSRPRPALLPPVAGRGTQRARVANVVNDVSRPPGQG